MRKIIYADNAATTQLDTEVFDEMKPYLLENYGNASQPYSFSRVTKMALENARKTIAKCINADPSEIYFTSGGTESDNWAIKCFALPTDIKHIVISNIEHHAVINACKAVVDANIYYLKANSDGYVNPDELEQILSRKRDCIASCESTLVSVMLVNNEIGTIQPIQRLAEIAHKYGAKFHTDAVQAVGHIPLDVKSLGVDMLSASAHKFNGPKGVGFFYCKGGIIPLLNGGGQENGVRAGTENVAAIVGMAKALKSNVDNMELNMAHILDCEKAFYEVLNNSNYPFIINGKGSKVCGNINISFQGKSGEALMHLLDLKGVIIATGAACDSVKNQISHVIKAIGVPADYAEGTIRITFGKNNTIEEAKAVACKLIDILAL